MKLIITTPEMLEEIVKSSMDSVLKNFYIQKAASESKKKNHTIKGAAEKCNVSILTIRNYIQKGYIQAFKIGNRVLISDESLEKAMTEVKSLRYKR